MFTGIIQTVAPVIKSASKDGSLHLTVEKPKSWKFRLGDSIALDGVCLTVSALSSSRFEMVLMPETLKKTTFGHRIPKNVNLEMCLKVSDLLGGSLVLGHVDTLGKVLTITSKRGSCVYKIGFPKKFRYLAVEKGSIVVDGISLTVVDVGADWLTVALIPYTLENTTITSKKVGDKVNLEFDAIAKYISAAVRASRGSFLKSRNA